jgi:hypothetical protein
MNPRYGLVGLLAFPYFVFFELLAPILEGLGYLLIVPGLWAGLFTVHDLILFFLVAVAYGVLFSTGSVLLEEVSFRRYPRPLDLLNLIFTAVAENFGYRQITVWWRIKGIYDYVRGDKSWGVIQRVGFEAARH